MLLFWLGIFFLSALHLFIFPIYSEQNREFWPFILGIGLVLNIIGCYCKSSISCHEGSKSNRRILPEWQTCLSSHPHPLTKYFLIPVVTGIFAFHFPYNLPLYVLAAAIILIYTIKWNVIKPAIEGIFITAIILAFQTASVVPYFKFAARYHEINLFSPFFYWILKGVGVPCSYSQNTIFAQTTQGTLELVTSWEKLGLFVFITFTIGCLVFLFSKLGHLFLTGFWRKVATLFSVTILFVTIRYIFLCIVFLEINKAELFWYPIIVSLSFLPLPFILWRFLPMGDKESDRCNDSNLPEANTNALASYKHLFIGIAMFLFAFSLICCFRFQDPGTEKKGRILIDEFYSNWEWTDKKFDTKWYGVQSVYNYYCFANYLNHFYTVDRLKESIDSNKLKNYDVLIIKTPTTPFKREEMDIIEQFVKDGGGLFLIGDHTNVFGTTINLNPLSKRFGFSFGYDATYNLETSDLHFHRKNRLFTHASVANMPYFLYATSSSMYAPFFAEDTMISSNLKTLYMDYSRGGYFPEKNTVTNYTFGLFLQSSGLKYGKGRVLAFADSTCFSNFYMHIPGKPEYALGSINWLNRTNRYNFFVKAVSLIIIAISLSFIIYMFIKIIARKHGLSGSKDATRVLLLTGLFGVALSSIFCDILSSKHYKPPSPHTPMIKIGFEEKYCTFRIPSVQLLHNPSIDYQTFYVWSQRLGYMPTLFSLDEQPDDFDVIIMTNPQKHFSEKELKKIDQYVTNGGKLLLIDYPKGINSTARQILEPYGLTIDNKKYQENVDIVDLTGKVGTLKAFAPISGGEGLLFTNDNQQVVAKKKHGNGTITVMACSTSLTNSEMGETESVPDEHQQFLYKLEFWLLSSIIRDNFTEFSDFAIEE